MTTPEEAVVIDKFDDAVLAVLRNQPAEKPNILSSEITRQLPPGSVNEMGMLKCHIHIDPMSRTGSMIFSSLIRLQLLGKVVRVQTVLGNNWGRTPMTFMAKDVPLDEIDIPPEADMQKEVMSLLLKRIAALEKRLSVLENK